VRAAAGARVAGAILILLLGCGEDSVCETAADKLQQCKIGDAVAEQGFARVPLAISRDDCTGTNECLARCVAPATCGELEFVVVGGSTDPNQPPVEGGPKLYGCITACVE
jgi:hypothetical protein